MHPVKVKCREWDMGNIPVPFRNYRIGEFITACLYARKNGSLPQKHLLRPEFFPSCLPYVWLYQYDHHRQDFVCRLAGEKAQAAAGMRMLDTGLADIVTAETYPDIVRNWQRAMDTPACIYGTYDLARMSGSGGRAERLVMPLQSPAGEENMLFGISIFNLEEGFIPDISRLSDEVSFYNLDDF